MLPQLTALRVLFPPESDIWTTMRGKSALHIEMMGLETWRDEYRNLQWLGIGGYIVQLHGRRKLENGQYRGVVKLVSWDQAKHVGIFGLDNGDL